MKQYYGIKAVHGDAILLFRVGDFYETFGEDAIKASKILGITLTRRANGAASYVELAGFPYHAVDTYLPKLVRAGERVAICEQLEDPKTTKKIVKRGVIELVTPGISLSDNILSCKENTFLAAVHFADKRTGVAFLDLSTGEFFAAEGDSPYVDKLLANLSPKEVIYQKGYESEFSEAFGTKHYTYRLDPWMFAENSARDKLLAQFGTTSLKGFGIEQMPAAITAAGAILYYLEFTEHRQTGHISSISRIDEDRYVWIDKFSIRNLELFHGQRRAGRLFAVRRAGPDRIADGRADVPALDLAPAERPRTDQSPARRRVAAPRRRLIARDARRGGRLDGRSGTDHLARCGRTGNPEGSRTTEKRAVRRRKDQDRHGAVRAGAPEGNGREARPLPEGTGPHRARKSIPTRRTRFRKAE